MIGLFLMSEANRIQWLLSSEKGTRCFGDSSIKGPGARDQKAPDWHSPVGCHIKGVGQGLRVWETGVCLIPGFIEANGEKPR